MERLKRVFQCVIPSIQNTSSSDINESKKSHDSSAIDHSSPKPVKDKVFYTQFQAHYKQQHLTSMAESHAMFEKQKLYIEKRLQYIKLQIEKVEQLQKQGKDLEWVKFE